MKSQRSAATAQSRAAQVPILRPGKAGWAIVLLAAFVAVIPQLIRGNSCGHDFDVHLVSWLDCVNAWRHGILYPHWTPSANYGAGEPRFVFYPPLTWMLGAMLGLIFPWSFAPIALTFLCLAGAGLATRALALEACDDAVATLAGCASIFSGFALFTAYERSAFPEFAGGFWLPLLLLYALRDRAMAARPVPSPPGSPRTGLSPWGGVWRKGGRPDAQPDARSASSAWRRALDGSTAPLALALAGAWLSNPPLGVMASYLLAAVALLWALLNKTGVPLLRVSLAAMLGFGIAAVYWIPAALERPWVDIRQAYDDPGYNFENSWLFARHANPLLALHDVVLHTASWIAISMIAVALAGLVVSWRRGTLPVQGSTGSRRWWIPSAAIPIVVLFLLFPISRPLWYLLPEWRFLQYPWRWLEAAEAPMAIFFAAAVWPSTRRARTAVAAACTAAFLVATGIAATSFFQACNPEDTVASTLADYHSGVGFEGMYEYEPPGADEALIATGLPPACLVSDPATVLGIEDQDGNLVWNPAQGSCETTFAAAVDRGTGPEHRRIRAVTPHAGYLVLRLLSYPAWGVRVNGQAVTNLPKREDGLLAVPVPQGAVDLTADWEITADVVTSRWVSAASVLLLLAVGFLERQRGAGPRLS